MINETETAVQADNTDTAEQNAPEAAAAEEMPAGTGGPLTAASESEAGQAPEEIQPAEAQEAQQAPAGPGQGSAVPQADTVTQGGTITQCSAVPVTDETSLAEERPPRDWETEWGALAKEHPEVIGAKLPDELFRACVASDRPVVQVYEAFMLKSAQSEMEKYKADAQSELSSVKAELEKLKAENAILRRNAETAARAPVKASTGMAADTEPEDPFLRAFNRY